MVVRSTAAAIKSLKRDKAAKTNDLLEGVEKNRIDYEEEVVATRERISSIRDALLHPLEEKEGHKIIDTTIQGFSITLSRYNLPGCGVRTNAELPISLVVPSEYNSREVYSEDQIARLVEDIGTNGQKEPISVLFNEAKLIFEILDGETRFVSKQNLGHQTIACRIFTEQDYPDYLDRLAFSYKENHKVKTNCAYDNALAAYKAREKGFTLEEISERMGIPKGSLKNLIPVAKMEPRLANALKSYGAPFDRHMLESLKSLSKTGSNGKGDSAAADLVQSLARRSRTEKLTAAYVTKEVGKEIKRIQEEEGLEEKRVATKQNRSFSYKDPNTGEKVADVKFLEGRKGAVSVVIKQLNKESDLILEVERLMESLSLKSGLVREETKE